MTRIKTLIRFIDKKYVTTYAEGLACNNFDKRNLYNTQRNDCNTWWVLGQLNLHHTIKQN